MRRIALLGLLITGLLASGCFLNVSSYRDADGSLVYVGEVYNAGDPLISATVEGTFYDAAGNVIATQTGNVCRVMPNKSVAPFEVNLPPGTPDPARVEWKLLGDRVDDAYLATGLTARAITTVKDFQGMTHVYGEIKNESANVYRRPLICAAWTDADGTVLRVGYAEGVRLRFDPGDVVAFDLSHDVPPEAVGLNFYLDAGVAPPGTPVLNVVDLPASAYRNPMELTFGAQGTTKTLVGAAEIHNTTNSTILPLISAEIRDANGALIAANGGWGFCIVGVPPGGYSFVTYLLTVPASSTIEPDIHVEGWVLSHSHALTVNNVSVNATGRVTGSIRNTTSLTLDIVTACAGVYDSGGDLIGAFPVQVTLPVGGLPPNQTVNFSEDVPYFEGTPAEAVVVADGTDLE